MIIDTTCSVIERKIKEAAEAPEAPEAPEESTLTFKPSDFILTMDPATFDCAVVFGGSATFNDSFSVQLNTWTWSSGTDSSNICSLILH